MQYQQVKPLFKDPHTILPSPIQEFLENWSDIQKLEKLVLNTDIKELYYKISRYFKLDSQQQQLYIYPQDLKIVIELFSLIFAKRFQQRDLTVNYNAEQGRLWIQCIVNQFNFQHNRNHTLWVEMYKKFFLMFAEFFYKFLHKNSYIIMAKLLSNDDNTFTWWTNQVKGTIKKWNNDLALTNKSLKNNMKRIEKQMANTLFQGYNLEQYLATFIKKEKEKDTQKTSITSTSRNLYAKGFDISQKIFNTVSVEYSMIQRRISVLCGCENDGSFILETTNNKFLLNAQKEIFKDQRISDAQQHLTKLYKLVLSSQKSRMKFDQKLHKDQPKEQQSGWSYLQALSQIKSKNKKKFKKKVEGEKDIVYQGSIDRPRNQLLSMFHKNQTPLKLKSILRKYN